MALKIKTNIKVGMCEDKFRNYYISNMKNHLKHGRFPMFRHLLKDANFVGCDDITIGELD